MAVYWNYNSKKKKVGKVPEDILSIRKGQCGIQTFRILKYLLTHKYNI